MNIESKGLELPAIPADIQEVVRDLIESLVHEEEDYISFFKDRDSFVIAVNQREVDELDLVKELHPVVDAVTQVVKSVQVLLKETGFETTGDQIFFNVEYVQMHGTEDKNVKDGDEEFESPHLDDDLFVFVSFMGAKINYVKNRTVVSESREDLDVRAATSQLLEDDPEARRATPLGIPLVVTDNTVHWRGPRPSSGFRGTIKIQLQRK